MNAPTVRSRRVEDPFDGVDRVCFEAHTTWALLPVSLALVGFYAAFAAMHHSGLTHSPGPVMDAVAAAGTAVALGVAFAAWQHRIPDHLAHAAMTLLVASTTVIATVHLVLTRDPAETVGFLFLLVGIGVVLLDRAWLIPSAIGVWACWAFGVGWIGGTAVEWAHWVFYMFTASMLGTVVAVLRRRSIDRANTALRRAVQAATEDPATGLSNRRGLAMMSRELVELGRRRGEIVHATFLDVDGLKRINDRQGHDAGDRVIVAVAQAIRGTCRSSDIVARWGGDEFVVVGLGASDRSLGLEQRVSDYLAEHHPGDPTLSRLRISAGRAEIAPWDDPDTESLLWRADHDMYQRRALRTVGRDRLRVVE